MRKNNNAKQQNSSSKNFSRSNSYGKGGARNGKGNFSSGRKGSKTYDTQEQLNDETWYGADPSLLRDAASIPFSAAIGTRIDYGSVIGNNGNIENNTSFYNGLRSAVPGVMSFRITPAFGYANSGNDPINVAANAIYSFLRQANSGAKNYDAPDMMIYCLAMTQVYSYISFLQRVYGYATLYSQRNRYLPKALLYSNLVSFNSVMNNLASFRYAINLLINKASSLAVPGNMTIFQRHAFLYRDVYSEGESIKDQLYQFVPDGFFRFKLNDDKSGMLEYASLISVADVTGESAQKLCSVSALIDYGNKLLDPLITSEDFNIMSGDILKAYGDNIIKLTSLPTEFPIVPVHDYTVLQQMKNATIVGEAMSALALVQNSTKEYLEFRPVVDGLKSTSTWEDRVPLRTQLSNPIISVGSAEPTPGEVMEVTRLKATLMQTDSTTVPTYWINCGTEIVRNVMINTIDTVTNEVMFRALNYNGVAFEVVAAAGHTTPISKAVSNLALMKNFRYAPIMYVHYGMGAGDLNTKDIFMGVAWDFDNYSVITPEILHRIHEAAIMNMLHVPHISKM